jgi:hypothetical protein
MRCRLMYTYTYKRADQCLVYVSGSLPMPVSKGKEIKHGLLIKATGALKNRGAHCVHVKL